MLLWLSICEGEWDRTGEYLSAHNLFARSGILGFSRARVGKQVVLLEIVNQSIVVCQIAVLEVIMCECYMLIVTKLQWVGSHRVINQ